ncbi:alpha/beta fold hydrolase [Hylemonella sp. W303a]|uniref:alpha/beta fold hydrolase n=1 Tax=Hylemonella sp. W303a TaxID=3389873 RepID=UPI00396B167A
MTIALTSAAPSPTSASDDEAPPPVAYAQQASFLPSPSSLDRERQRRLGHAVNLLGRLFPGPATQWLWRLWFTPPHTHPNQRARDLLATVEHRFEVYSGEGGALVHGWGNGPAVLLAHGWGAYGAQLGSFVPVLQSAGYRVLLLDAPGHGGQRPRPYRLDQYAQLLHDVILHAGDVHAVIGHSLGATAMAMALNRLDSPATYVGVAPTANLKSVLRTFQQRLGLSPDLLARLERTFADVFGPSWWRDYSLDHHLPRLRGRALLVHDQDDSEASPENSRYLARLRAGTALHWSQGLGHNRVLHDREVVQTVAEFIARH